MLRTVAIKLKIPDNEAYTALSALRRLGIDITRVERAEIWSFEDRGDEHFVGYLVQLEPDGKG